MESGDKFQGSHGKGRKNRDPRRELTGTPSGTVNSCNFVNTSVNTHRFKSDLQRISKEHRLKAENVAKEHNRKTFNEVLDVYVFCYNFCEELSLRLGCSIFQLPKVIDKFVPQTPALLIERKVDEFLDELNLNGSDRINLKDALLYVLLNVKVHNKPSDKVLKPLFLLRKTSRSSSQKIREEGIEEVVKPC